MNRSPVPLFLAWCSARCRVAPAAAAAAAVAVAAEGEGDGATRRNTGWEIGTVK